MEGASSPGWLIARQSACFVLRERTVALLSGMFVALVLISAWLGWSATSTVNRIYLDAAAFLQAAGQPVPTNPVLDISPLSLMRNMSVYVALIGALSAIVIGNRLIGLDRKAGVLPLIGSRPLGRNAYAGGTIAALTGLILTLAAVAALVAVATFLLLPAITLPGGAVGATCRVHGGDHALHGLLWPDRPYGGGLCKFGNRGAFAAGHPMAEPDFHPSSTDRKPEPDSCDQSDFGAGRPARHQVFLLGGTYPWTVLAGRCLQVRLGGAA